LSSELSQIASQIPVEIWKEIIFLAPSSEPKVKEKVFSKLACVSKSWSKIIRELVRLNFAKFELSNCSVDM
jgi:hypothetical protein